MAQERMTYIGQEEPTKQTSQRRADTRKQNQRGSSNPTPGIDSKELNSKSQVSALLWFCSINQITKIWKQPKCLFMDGWIKKMWYIHIQGGVLFSL